MRNADHGHTTNCGNLAVARHMTYCASVVVRRTVTSIVFVWAMSAASAFASPILSISPAASMVNVHEDVFLTIDIADVVDLYSYNFDLTFDPTILSFVEIVEGGFPQGGLSPGDTYFIPGDGVTTSGVVSFTGNTLIALPSGVSGTGTLAIAKFLAITPGITSIVLSDQLFLDSTLDLDNPISFSQINEATVQVNGVASVPDAPSSLTLLVSVLALAACRRSTHA